MKYSFRKKYSKYLIAIRIITVLMLFLMGVFKSAYATNVTSSDHTTGHNTWLCGWYNGGFPHGEFGLTDTETIKFNYNYTSVEPENTNRDTFIRTMAFRLRVYEEGVLVRDSTRYIPPSCPLPISSSIEVPSFKMYLGGVSHLSLDSGVLGVTGNASVGLRPTNGFSLNGDEKSIIDFNGGIVEGDWNFNGNTIINVIEDADLPNAAWTGSADSLNVFSGKTLTNYGGLPRFEEVNNHGSIHIVNGSLALSDSEFNYNNVGGKTIIGSDSWLSSRYDPSVINGVLEFEPGSGIGGDSLIFDDVEIYGETEIGVWSTVTLRGEINNYAKIYGDKLVGIVVDEPIIIKGDGLLEIPPKSSLRGVGVLKNEGSNIRSSGTISVNEFVNNGVVFVDYLKVSSRLFDNRSGVIEIEEGGTLLGLEEVSEFGSDSPYNPSVVGGLIKSESGSFGTIDLDNVTLEGQFNLATWSDLFLEGDIVLDGSLSGASRSSFAVRDGAVASLIGGVFEPGFLHGDGLFINDSKIVGKNTINVKGFSNSGEISLDNGGHVIFNTIFVDGHHGVVNLVGHSKVIISGQSVYDGGSFVSEAGSSIHAGSVFVDGVYKYGKYKNIRVEGELDTDGKIGFEGFLNNVGIINVTGSSGGFLIEDEEVLELHGNGEITSQTRLNFTGGGFLKNVDNTIHGVVSVDLEKLENSGEIIIDGGFASIFEPGLDFYQADLGVLKVNYYLISEELSLRGGVVTGKGVIGTGADLSGVTVMPGDGVGGLIFDGNIKLSEQSNLLIDINPDNSLLSDRLIATGDVKINGNLYLNIENPEKLNGDDIFIIASTRSVDRTLSEGYYTFNGFSVPIDQKNDSYIEGVFNNIDESGRVFDQSGSISFKVSYFDKLIQISEVNLDVDDNGVLLAQDSCPHISNPEQEDTDRDGEGNACDSDDDNDGMPDRYELSHGLDPLNAVDAQTDKDEDRITNLQEYIDGTDPTVFGTGLLDFDQDGMADAFEVEYDLDPFDASDAPLDNDEDSLTNLQEAQAGTNPNSEDTDGNGIHDPNEINTLKQLIALSPDTARSFSSISISGNTLAYGIPAEDTDTTTRGGAVYLFTRNDETSNWVLDVKIFNPEPNHHDLFGYDVEVSDKHLVVTSYSDDDVGDQSGAVYTYHKDVNGDWNLVNKLLPDVEALTADRLLSFGSTIDLYEDQLAIGTVSAPEIYLYDFVGETWQLSDVVSLTASDGNTFAWGPSSLALSQDMLAVGNYPFDIESGEAYVISKDPAGDWSQTAIIENPNALDNYQFGFSIDIDGQRIAVGANQGLCEGGFGDGCVHIFELDEAQSWVEVERLSPPENQRFDDFGDSVALQDSILVVGDSANHQAGYQNGAAAIYHRNLSGEWPLVSFISPVLNVSTPQTDIRFGDEIAIDGYTLLLNDSVAFDRGVSAYSLKYYLDPDNDGVDIPYDNCEEQANPDQLDLDNDGLGDVCDPDRDGDGVDNDSDAFPDDSAEQFDTDQDGIGNNADTDDDNDGYTDFDEVLVGTDPLDETNRPADFDRDFVPDLIDADDDNDSVLDVVDAFPFDATETVDTDKDSIGNNADTDDDNDGFSDSVEILLDTNPLDSGSFPADFDTDGIPDALDEDDDNDGVNDDADAFPFDDSETVDSDGDLIGNNADTDDDNDGLPDTWELQFGLDPFDSSDAVSDLDGDGLTARQEFELQTDPTRAEPKPKQIIVSPETQYFEEDETFSLALQYDVEDDNSQLSGLGLRIHFNSDKVSMTSFRHLFEIDLLAQDNSAILDAEDFDNNTDTDSYVLLAWSSLTGEWPNQTLPLALATVDFIVADNVDTFAVGFSASSTSLGYELQAPTITVNKRKASFDLDQNGTADALTDGLLFLRYTFGFRGEALISGVVANDSTLQTTADIEASISASIDEIGDIDGNGNADALTDGLLLLRYLFGFRGDALVRGVVEQGAERSTAEDIEAYIQAY